MQPLYSKALRGHTPILPATSPLELKVSFPISAAGLKPGTTPDSRHPVGIDPTRAHRHDKTTFLQVPRLCFRVTK